LKTYRTRTGGRTDSLTHQEAFSTENFGARIVQPAMRTTYPDSGTDRPLPLLSTNQISDFPRNFAQMEKYAKRPYSLLRVLRSMCTTPPSLDAFEMEVHQELSSLSKGRNITGKLVPIEALSPWRRDLTIGGYPQVVQTTVGDQVLPFLRAKTVCGRLGATLLDGLTGGNLKFPGPRLARLPRGCRRPVVGRILTKASTRSRRSRNEFRAAR
jgi:hypothetical protein